MDIKRAFPIIVSITALAGTVAIAVFMVASPFDEHQLVAPGSVVIDSVPIEVQSGVAGTIAELRVRNGDKVAPGDVLVRLDSTLISTKAMELSRSRDELMARRARLRAEQRKAPIIAFPDSLAERAADPGVGALLAAEVDQFNGRRAVQQAQASELLERVGTLKKEIGAYALQAAAKSGELGFVMVQLKAARDLRAKSLMPSATLAGLEREAIRLQGERDGVLGASIAQAEGRIAETRFLILQVDREREAEVLRDLRDTESKLADVSERQRAAEDQLERLEVIAPKAGVVAIPATRAIGSLVSVGDGIITIAPPVDGFAIDASIAQSDIAAVRLGQTVMVQLPGSAGQEGAQLAGTLSQIAPIAGDGAAAQGLFKARIALAPTDCSRVGPVQPGTEARVVLGAGRRSMLSSMLRPVGHGIARALKAI